MGAALVLQGKRRLSVSAVLASKGGVHALTVAWAAELAPHDIRVNTLAPGIIRTPLVGDDPDALSSAAPSRTEPSRAEPVSSHSVPPRRAMPSETERSWHAPLLQLRLDDIPEQVT